MLPTSAIALISADAALTDRLREQLPHHAIRLEAAARPEALRPRLAARAVDLVVLDALMPDGDACPLLATLRREHELPLIVLGTGSDPMERVRCLDAGADDVVARPVDPRELVARVRSVLRRRATGAGGPRFVHFGRWTLDRFARTLNAPTGLAVPLSEAEFRLLAAFLAEPGVLTRDRLIDLARGRSLELFDRSIDLLVSRLRTKLDDDPAAPRYIRTVRGVGYLFAAERG